MLVKASVSLILLTITAIFVAWTFGLSGLVAALQNLSPLGLLIVLAALLANALAAALRFKVIAGDVGHPIGFRQAIAAVSVGALGGAAFFQLAGQLMARGAMMSRGGIPVASVVVMTLYERAIAAVISGLLALAGAYYIFGQIVLDNRAGGGEFIKIVIGLLAATTAGALFGYGRRAAAVLSPIMTTRFASRLLRAIALSLIVQLPMVLAYTAIAHVLSPVTPLRDLAAAATLVMFAASIPVSLAGWGVREMSAVFALGAIGVGKNSAFVAALIIGTGSLLTMIALAALSVTSWQSRGRSREATSAAPIDYLTLLFWSLPLAAVTLVLFQLHIPIASGTLLNANLADPIVLLGASLFILHWCQRGRFPVWRIPHLNAALFAMTAVLTLSLIAGAARFGYTEWAVVNRFLGWFVLLSYAATGALIVLGGSKEGFRRLLMTYVAATVAVVVLEYLLVLITATGIDSTIPVVPNAIQGFAQNRNSFAFQMLMAFAAAAVVLRDPRLRIGFFAVLFVGLWLCGSRSGWGTLLVLVLASLYLRTIRWAEIVRASALAALLVLILVLLAGSGSGVTPGLWPEPSSTHERMLSIREGWAMFVANPVFGAGLGAFRTLLIPSAQETSYPLLIHSTPIWLLAELGVVGLVTFAVPTLAVLASEFRRAAHDPAAQFLILCLLAMGVMAMPADMLYQRTFWILLGAGLAVPVALNAQSPHPRSD